MANFTVKIEGVEKTIQRFERYGEAAEEAVFAGVMRTAFDVVNHARTNVHKITSTLARSIGIKDESRQDLSVLVSTNVEYAAVEEYGFNGIIPVFSHTRTISQAFGKPIPVQTVQVRGHFRRLDRPPHPYMGPAAEHGQERIDDNVRQELEALEF